MCVQSDELVLVVELLVVEVLVVAVLVAGVELESLEAVDALVVLELDVLLDEPERLSVL